MHTGYGINKSYKKIILFDHYVCYCLICANIPDVSCRVRWSTKGWSSVCIILQTSAAECDDLQRADRVYVLYCRRQLQSAMIDKGLIECMYYIAGVRYRTPCSITGWSSVCIILQTSAAERDDRQRADRVAGQGAGGQRFPLWLHPRVQCSPADEPLSTHLW